MIAVKLALLLLSFLRKSSKQASNMGHHPAMGQSKWHGTGCMIWYGMVWPGRYGSVVQKL